MQEIIAKSAKTLYIVTYSIFLGFGALIVLIFSMLVGNLGEINEPEALGFSIFFIVMGVILIIASIIWLIYFIKMPVDAVKLCDGKLYFRNGIVCSPTELDNYSYKGGGVDGAIFDFGTLIITVKGNKFKLRFVKRAAAAVNRLHMLKAEYQVKEHIAKNSQSSAEQIVRTEQPEQNIEAGGEENDG